jgi:hypothetical protein
MKSSAWAGLMLLGLLGSAPGALRAQSESPVERAALGRNYPNPFNPETFIPFQLKAELFIGGQRPVVSLKIYNVLAQLVAVPIVQGSGERLENASLNWNGTGEYTAYWDGKVQGSEREAASGVYVYQLNVRWVENGKSRTQVASNKMTVMK